MGHVLKKILEFCAALETSLLQQFTSATLPLDQVRSLNWTSIIMFRKSEFIRLRFHDFQWIILMDLLTPFLVFLHHFTKLMQELSYILLFRFAAHTADINFT